jgi:hypothetical protein
MKKRMITTVAVLAALAGASGGSSAALAAGAPAAGATPPSSVTITEMTGAKYTATASDLQAGLITFHLVNQLALQRKGELLIFAMKPGATPTDFHAMLPALFGTNLKAAAAATRWTIAHVYAYGGNLGGPSANEQVVLPAGTYYVADLMSWGKNPATGITTFKVSGTPHGSLPSAPETVSMVEHASNMPRFAPSTTTLANGWVRINNTTADDHMVLMVPVKPGTTADQLIAGFFNPSAPSPFLGLPEGTDVLQAHSQLNVQIAGPPGYYAITCLVSDPTTGKPHILMGMTTFVNVK